MSLTINHNLTEAELRAQWNALGANFATDQWNGDVDREELLVRTADVASKNVRILEAACTWLVSTHGEQISDDVLAEKIDTGEVNDVSTLGYIIESATTRIGYNRFTRTLSSLRSRKDGCDRALSDAENANQAYAAMARKRSDAVGLKWGRWYHFELRGKHWGAK